MHCLADHASHPVEHQDTKLCRITSRAFRDRAKRIYKLLNSKQWPNKRVISPLFGTAYPKTIQDQHIKFCGLAARGRKIGAKIVCKWSNPTWKRFLIKNIEYFQTKEICIKLLKLIQGSLLGSEQAAKFFNEQHINICQLFGTSGKEEKFFWKFFS